MGFLDHSTNNIIIDAVLTDKGRELLARNDGSFSIKFFALGDDEVDYTMIQKFGRQVGAEKIIKNTPVLEAQTTAQLGLKYRLVSLSNPNLTRIPNYTLTGEGLSTDKSSVTMNKTGQDSVRSLSLGQSVANENTIDPEVQDQAFIVRINNRFLTIGTNANVVRPRSISKDQVATYVFTRDAATTGIGGSKLSMTLRVRNINEERFTAYGDGSTIKTPVTIQGVQSGATTQFEVQISK